jgi:hypothetical protein
MSDIYGLGSKDKTTSSWNARRKPKGVKKIEGGIESDATSTDTIQKFQSNTYLG